eukprot:CAMPEP_0114979932 /NCGR_PEP_ID=MMETSP0216-20121206/4664_1 /TAXON_ID=223996 /ORGANISM="Protocruzia adherens, Strain Boccale" /LENGTH=304 /DNA_ID=CAMNT_0002341349 /DNA_START=46 /DNA_END=956 /DNA_ORIENTATION=-
MTNYLQLVTLASSFELQWPTEFESFFQGQEQVGAYGEQVFSFDCFLKAKDGSNGVHVVYSKLLMMNLSPILVFFVLAAFWVALKMIHGRQEARDRSVGKEVPITRRASVGMISSLVIVFFLLHPVMVRYNFSLFSCRSLGDGNSYLTRDTSIQCWSGEHLAWSLGVALPGIVVWGLAAPLIAAWFMQRSKHELKNPEMVAKYGFIYKGFRPRYYFWEIYIVFRKIALISVAVFLYNINRVVQALICFALILAAYRLHELYRPYVTRALNNLEVRSLAVALVTIYCGLYFLTDDIDRSSQVILLV